VPHRRFWHKMTSSVLTDQDRCRWRVEKQK
jgi:hypothetical protein